jgi:hypothetical protein
LYIAGKYFIKCGCLKSIEKLLGAGAAALDNEFGNTSLAQGYRLDA